MDADFQRPNWKLGVAGTFLSVAGLILRMGAIRRKGRPFSLRIAALILVNYTVAWLLVVLLQGLVGIAVQVLWLSIRHLLRRSK